VAPPTRRERTRSTACVVERLLENLDRVLLGLALDYLERAIDDRLGHRFLPSNMTEFMNL